MKCFERIDMNGQREKSFIVIRRVSLVCNSQLNKHWFDVGTNVTSHFPYAGTVLLSQRG